MSDSKQEGKLCSECQKLVGGNRYTKPHAMLVQTKFIKVSSAMGPSDETYYRCSTCGHEWLHETGSCGMGWVK